MSVNINFGYRGSEDNVPIATVIWWAGKPIIANNKITNLPVNYLECNGDILDKNQYDALFQEIGYSFGGSGNNFYLPDLRGYFIRGWDHGANIDKNRIIKDNDDTGRKQDDAFKEHYHIATSENSGSHDHTITINTENSDHNHELKYYTGIVAGSTTTGITGSDTCDKTKEKVYNIINSGSHTHKTLCSENGSHTHIINIYNTGDVETRPKNIVLIPCIKYK